MFPFYMETKKMDEKLILFWLFSFFFVPLPNETHFRRQHPHAHAAVGHYDTGTRCGAVAPPVRRPAWRQNRQPVLCGVAERRVPRRAYRVPRHRTRRLAVPAGVVLGCRMVLRPAGLRARRAVRPPGAVPLSRRQRRARRLSEPAGAYLRQTGRHRPGRPLRQAVSGD